MTQDPDDDRIRRKAHELWEAEGHPHGRDRAHWEQAREIIAIEDSMSSTLLPRNTGAEEPEEPALSVDNLGDLPNLTDQGEHALTDTSREPEQLAPSSFVNATGDTVGGVARPKQDDAPDIDDEEIVSPPPQPELIVGKSAAVVTVPAPAPSIGKPADGPSKPPAPSGDRPVSVTGKTVPKKTTGAVSMTKVSKPRGKKGSRKKG